MSEITDFIKKIKEWLENIFSFESVTTTTTYIIRDDKAEGNGRPMTDKEKAALKKTLSEMDKVFKEIDKL